MFFANFKMKIFISFFVFGNTPLGLPFKETFNDILISSVVLSIHTAKVCVHGNLCKLLSKLFQTETDAVIYTDQFTCYIGTWTRRLKFVAILNAALGLI